MTKNALSHIINEIALRIDPGGETYEDVGYSYELNRGIVWRLVNDPDYEPSQDTLHKLGIYADPRKRYRINVDEETHTRIQQAAAREGVTVAEWVREKVRE